LTHYGSSSLVLRAHSVLLAVGSSFGLEATDSVSSRSLRFLILGCD
jgi:hypothetical protein